MPIKVYEGEARAGKTLHVVKSLYQKWKKGAKIYSNIPLFFTKQDWKDQTPTTKNIVYYETALELRRCHDCEILIDEDNFVENRDWQALPKAFYLMINQHGHRRINIWITALSAENLDVKFRRAHPYYYKVGFLAWCRVPHNTHKLPFLHVMTIDAFPYFKIISKLWTRKQHNSYGDVGLKITTVKVLIKNRKVLTTISGQTT